MSNTPIRTGLLLGLLVLAGCQPAETGGESQDAATVIDDASAEPGGDSVAPLLDGIGPVDFPISTTWSVPRRISTRP